MNVGVNPSQVTFSGSLDNVELVFADSVRALQLAHAAGLDPAIPVLSFSPAVTSTPAAKARPADTPLTPAFIRAMDDATIALSHELMDLFADAPPGRRVAAARESLAALHPYLYKAAALRPEIVSKRFAVAHIAYAKPEFDYYLGDRLAKLARHMPQACLINVPHELVADQSNRTRPPIPSLSQRMGFATWQALAYRAVTKVMARLGRGGLRGGIAVLRENELVKETATYLMLRGFGVGTIAPLVESLQERVESESLPSALSDAFRRHLGPFLEPSVAEVVLGVWRGNMARSLWRYDSAYRHWESQPEVQRSRAVLSSYLATPETSALSDVLRAKGKPFFAFQHGVTIEINARQSLYDVLYENAAGDPVVTFNPAAVDKMKEHARYPSPVFSAGMPRDYRASLNRVDDQGKPPIWYVATSLHIGNAGILSEGVNDHDKTAFEVNMVRQVLSALPHRVAFKTYPGERYLDPDPVLEVIGNAPNVELVQERIDLRYMLATAQVLIAARSFSTPSWCIMSGRPLVFIDMPDQLPLLPEARAAFEASTFVFDAGSPTFIRDLTDFLSQPVADIVRQYEAKAAARAKLISRFIDGGGDGAGRRAAEFIDGVIRGKAQG